MPSNKGGQLPHKHSNANSESYISGRSLEGKNFITFGAKKTPAMMDRFRKTNFYQQMSTPQLSKDKSKKAAKLARNQLKTGSAGNRMNKLKNPKTTKGNKDIIAKYTQKLNVLFESGYSGKFKSKGRCHSSLHLDLKAVQKNINNSSKLIPGYESKKKYCFKNPSKEQPPLMYPGTTKNMMKNKFLFLNRTKEGKVGDPQ